jgi:hypothetical protein
LALFGFVIGFQAINLALQHRKLALKSFDPSGVDIHGHATLQYFDGDHQVPGGFFTDQGAFNRFERAMSHSDALAFAQEGRGLCGDAGANGVEFFIRDGMGWLPNPTIETTLLVVTISACWL